jgi:hypothetical protein
VLEDLALALGAVAQALLGREVDRLAIAFALGLLVGLCLAGRWSLIYAINGRGLRLDHWTGRVVLVPQPSP